MTVSHNSSKEKPNRQAHLQGYREVSRIWRAFYPRLTLGLVIAMTAALLALALMVVAASHIGAIAGVSAISGVLVLRGLGIARVASRYFERYVTHDAMFRALAATRIWFFRQLARRSDHGLGFVRSGDVLSRLVTDIDALDVIYLRLMVPLCAACATGLAVLAYAASISLTFATLLGGLLFTMIVVIPVIGAFLTLSKAGDVLTGQGALRTQALDYASGLRESAIYDGGQILARNVMAKAAQQARFEAKQAHRQSFANAAASLLGQAMVGACLLLLFWVARHDASLVARSIAMVFMVIAVLEVTGGLSRVGPLYGKVHRAFARVAAYIGNETFARETGRNFDAAFAKISFEQVSFQWDTGRHALLDACNLNVTRGARIAILGPSGAGKSSLVALLLKVVEPTAGRITIDDVPLAQIDTVDLRRHIAWLSQSTHIFADTVRHNLCLDGTPLPDGALWKVLEQAGLANVIRALPDGLESWIGEGGQTLSGGEGRRLALARILLSEAPIVVLDEPTSGLDAETERDFFETLNHTMEDRTLILVLHRLTGVEKLDSIWNLRDGHVEVHATA